jgi:hypothetical protein
VASECFHNKHSSTSRRKTSVPSPSAQPGRCCPRLTGRNRFHVGRRKGRDKGEVTVKPVSSRTDVQSLTMNMRKCVLLAEVCRSRSSYKGHTAVPLCRCRLTHFLQSDVGRQLSAVRQPINSYIALGTYPADHGTLCAYVSSSPSHFTLSCSRR